MFLIFYKSCFDDMSSSGFMREEKTLLSRFKIAPLEQSRMP